MFQKLAEKEGLVSQASGARIGGKQIAQLIAKNRSTAGLQNHDRHARINLPAQDAQDSPQVLLWPCRACRNRTRAVRSTGAFAGR